MVLKFINTVRDRIHIKDGGYRRNHSRALARRVEIDGRQARIIGSKGE